MSPCAMRNEKGEHNSALPRPGQPQGHPATHWHSNIFTCCHINICHVLGKKSHEAVVGGAQW